MAEQNNRIFIVDDDPATRETLTEVLSLKGYTAESAGTAEKAIEKIKNWPVDLFLIDLRMPGVGGVELLKKLDIINNTYEAIMITAYAGMDSAKEAMEYGAFSYISKPIMYKELAPLMKKALETVKLKKLRVGHEKELEEKVEARTSELKRETAEHKKAAEALKKSEEKYRGLFENSNDIIYTLDLSGNITSVNKAIKTYFGYKPEEVVGKSFIEFADKKNLPEIKKGFKQLVEGKEFNSETIMVAKDGKHHTIQFHSTPIKEEGKVVGVQGIVRDITKLKLVEGILSESEERYRNLFEQSPVGIGVTTLDGKLVYMNQKMADITGYSSNELEKTGISSTYEDLKDRKKLIDQLNRDGMVNDFHVRLKRKDGTLYDAQLNVSKVHIGGQDLLQTICVDITEQKKVEKALRESEEKLTTILQKSPIPTAVGGSDGSIISFNEALVKLIGYKQSEIKDVKDWARKLYPDKKYRDFVEKNIKQALAGQKQKSTEFTITCKDGSEKLIDFHTSFFKGGLIIQIIDITERKKAEEALQNERDNLKNIFNSMVDGVYIVDRNYNIQYVNPVIWLEFGPYTGKKCYTYFHDRQKVCPWCKNKEVYKGKTVQWEWHSPKNNKTYDLIDTPLKNPDGSFSKLEIFRDITERKKAEDSLKQKIVQLNSFINNIPDMAWLKDLNSNFIAANKAFGDAVGIDPEYLINHTCEVCFGKEAAKKFKEDDKKVIKGKKQVVFEESIIDAKKNKVWLETVKSPIIDESGKVIGTVGIARNITDRKIAEDEIKSHVHKLKERVKELNALNAVSKLIVKPEVTIKKALETICKIIPPVWQYPDITCARIIFKGEEYKTKNFSQTRWRQFAEISVNSEKKGSVEVCYLEEKPILDEGPFYKEERVLINAIAREIGEFLERKQAERMLHEKERQLSEQNVMLQGKNIALREVMDQLEGERDRLGKQMNINVDRLLLPLTTKLRSKGSKLDKTYIDLLEENLKDLATQFGGKISDRMLKLTQKEIEMCNMIKQGLTSKEIAKLLDISHRTVETHRNNIRKKLGIGKQEVNLVTYLKNIA